MKKIVSGTDMKKADAETINRIGIPSLVLMERAAECVAERIVEKEPKKKTVLVTASTGNNGADGLAAGRILHLAGFDVLLYIVGNPQKGSQEFQTQLHICRQLNIPETEAFENRDIVIDALFGVGLSRDVEGTYAEVIRRINEARNTVYAVDIPSGVDADTGKIRKTAVRADETVTFGVHKIGTVLYPGAEYCGQVTVADIGFPPMVYEGLPEIYHVEEKDLRNIPKRPNYSNKGTFGKVLIIAGSRDIFGAAYLCAKAAFRCGAGLVRILTVQENREALLKLLPEAMVNVYDEEHYDEKILDAALSWCNVVAVGPGLGVGAVQKRILERVLEAKLPTVIDADGLNNISLEEPLKRRLHKDVIITPHLGEMGRLMQTETAAIREHLLEYAEKAAETFGCVCILKDARTVVAENGACFINLTGNHGMATAGSGDVLTGILAGLAGVGTKWEDTAALGPYIHGLAGDIAAEKRGKTGMMAGDIIDALQDIFQ